MKNNDDGLHISILKTTLIILACISGILFVLYASQNYLTKMSVHEKSPKSPLERVPEGKGVFSLHTATDRTVFELQEDIDVLLTGFSKGSRIVTFDSVFDQLGSDLILKKVTAQDPYFEIRTIDKKKGWINGSLKDNEAPEGADLYYADLALLTFVHSKPGPIKINFDFRPGETRDSNMMQMSPPVDVLAEAKGITLYTGWKVDLTSKETYVIPGSDVSVSLIQTTIPDKQCYDCPVQAEIEVKKGAQSETRIFSLGGFDGKVVQTHEIFGYVFETSHISSRSAELYYAPLGTHYEK